MFLTNRAPGVLSPNPSASSPVDIGAFAGRWVKDMGAGYTGDCSEVADTGVGTGSVTFNVASVWCGIEISSNGTGIFMRATFLWGSSGFSLSNPSVVYGTPADSTPPTMTITASEVSSGDTSDDTTLSMTFESSEATSDFAVGDITVVNGALSSFSGSGTTYTATLTPAAAGSVSVDVGSAVFTDGASNDNTAAVQFTWVYDADGDGVGVGDAFPNADTNAAANGVSIATTPGSAASACTLDESAFSTASSFPSPVPANLSNSLALTVSFGLTGCQTGESIAVAIDLGQAIPADSKAYKVTADGWTEIPGASVSGTIVSYIVQDNGPLDQNPANGVIDDPIAVATPLSGSSSSAGIPTIPGWLLALLVSVMAFVGASRVRQAAGTF